MIGGSELLLIRVDSHSKAHSMGVGKRFAELNQVGKIEVFSNPRRMNGSHN